MPHIREIGFSLQFLLNHVLTISCLTEVKNLHDVVSEVWRGSTALIIDGSPDVIILGTRKVKSRGIEEPASEIIGKRSEDRFQ